MSAPSRMLMVPAAGVGSRLRTSTPKLLVPVAGVPMIDRLLARYRPWAARAVVVVHPSFEALVRQHLAGAPVAVTLAVQARPSGMLDAILLGRDAVAASDAERVWITWCDQVAVSAGTLSRLAAAERDHPGADMIMPTVVRADPYIHLQRGADGRIARVLHRREGDTLPQEGESDMGVFSLSRSALLESLVRFAGAPETGAATGERNFLPFIPWIAARGELVTFPVADAIEAVGVNTPEDLALVERHLSGR